MTSPHKDAHTALPWAFEHGRGFHRHQIVITANHAGMTAETPLAHITTGLDDAAEADAALIVRAVNNRDKLIAALNWFVMLQPLPVEGPNERFERIAEVFHRATGYLRPGKDCVMHSMEERQAAWDAWITEGVELGRSAIKAAEGAAP
jgi:hypothetical protein